MKLTKIQISALANKIYNQISSKIDAENKALSEDYGKFTKWKKENKEYIESLENAIKYCKKLLEFDDNCDNYYYYVNSITNINISNVLHSKFKNTLKLKSNPSIKSIERDIILETIEETNIDNLINKLVNKYLK